MMRTVLLSLLLLPVVSIAQTTFIKTPVRADPCVNDLFFVDLPLDVDVDVIPRDFEADLEADLTALARANVGWFCEPGYCGPLQKPGRLAARVARLLPRRDRTRTEERFLRVAFYYLPKPGSLIKAQRLLVRDSAACAAVANIKATVDALGDRDGLPFYVGRACTASGLQVGRPIRRPVLRADADLRRALPAVSADMLNWHLNMMGVDKPATARTPIVLVDTGVRDDVVPNIARWQTPSPVLPAAYDIAGRPVGPPAATRHPHGTDMALAMRQVTTAPLIDLPVLGVHGRVPLGQIARAVDAAAVRFRDQPGIINLSLGWAPEIERLRKLNRGACRTSESPAGEAMRAVLRGVRARHQRVMVVTAGGNRARIGRNYMATFANRYETGIVFDTDTFSPAKWGLEPTNGQTTLLTVGALQSTGRLAAMDQGQATLYAPGQHVMLQAEAQPPADICAAGQTEMQFPRTVSGSSIAAAFTSAVAARIWDRRPTASATEAARLLYLSGEPVGVLRDGRLQPYAGPSRIAARRLHAGRLEKLLRVDPLRLQRCERAGPAFTGGSVSALCRQVLENVGFDEALRAESPATTWPRTREPVCPPAQIGARAGLTLRSAASPVCGGDIIEPACDAIDLYSAGDGGPQPEIVVCEDCMLFQLDDHTIRMQGKLSGHLPEGTLIEEPWLIVYWDDGTKAALDLSDVNQTWAVGASIDISDITLDVGNRQLHKADIFLSTTVKTPTQTRGTTDMSPLRVEEKD